MISYLNTILTFKLKKEAPFRPYSKMCAYLSSTLLKYLLKTKSDLSLKTNNKLEVLIGSNPIFQLNKIKLVSGSSQPSLLADRDDKYQIRVLARLVIVL